MWFKRHLREKGQATFEYVFLLFIVFMLGGGILWQFNDAFRVFVSNYVGEYLACLLETGELPALGYEGAQGICQDEFQPFSLANGRPKLKDTGGKFQGGNSEGNWGNNDGGGSFQNAGKGQNEKSSGFKSMSGEPHGAEDHVTGSERIPGQTFSAQFDHSGESGRQKSVPLSKQDPPGGSAGFRNYVSTDLGNDINNASHKGGARVALTDQDGNKEVTIPRKPVPIPASEADAKDASRRVPADFAGKSKNTNLDAQQPGLTFGDLIKYILIAAILLAIIIFVGGQILRFSKSREK